MLFGIINYVAAKLPLRPLFVATSAFLFFMAVMFIGQAIQAMLDEPHSFWPTSDNGEERKTTWGPLRTRA